jgi:homoserine O-acetyltransferase/O-succinyltransferase
VRSQNWYSVGSGKAGDARRGKEARAALRAGILATLNVIGGVGLAQEPREAAPQANHSAATADLAPVQADAIFENYRLRNGKAFEQLRLHYATLGKPHRNAQGEIDNAVMVLHWTGNSGASLLTPEYIKALFRSGQPLDANRY